MKTLKIQRIPKVPLMWWIVSLSVGVWGAGSVFYWSVQLHRSIAEGSDIPERRISDFRDSYVSPAAMRLATMKSSVDYTSCCGIGHRMSKMVDAYYHSTVRKFGLRIFWGFCNETTEIFHHFFGAQPLDELQSVTGMGWAMKINNESPCFHKFRRTGNETECVCSQSFLEASGIFYNGLVRRFRERSQVEDFRKRHDFDNHFVLGLHVRAGNGEQGDFERKNRGIQNVSEWVKNVSNTLLTLSREPRLTLKKRQPALLFIATETASLVTGFRKLLSGKMVVVDYQQERLTDGSGVAFGQMGGSVKLKAEECLSHWKNPLMDMMILTSADVVIAGRPSSFTQSLPMSVALSRSEDQKKAQRPYCEVSFDGSAYHCFEDSHDWCCHGTTEFHLHGIRGYEFRRMPRPNFDTECNAAHMVVRRPSDGRAPTIRNHQAKSSFLPYNWDWVNSSMQESRSDG